jgi:hypothetical protein
VTDANLGVKHDVQVRRVHVAVCDRGMLCEGEERGRDAGLPGSSFAADHHELLDRLARSEADGRRGLDRRESLVGLDRPSTAWRRTARQGLELVGEVHEQRSPRGLRPHGELAARISGCDGAVVRQSHQHGDLLSLAIREDLLVSRVRAVDGYAKGQAQGANHLHRKLEIVQSEGRGFGDEEHHVGRLDRLDHRTRCPGRSVDHDDVVFRQGLENTANDGRRHGLSHVQPALGEPDGACRAELHHSGGARHLTDGVLGTRQGTRSAPVA